MSGALERLERELSELANAPVTLERPRDAAYGDYATNVALRTAAQRGARPLDLAERLAAAAAGRPGIERASAAAPGFVNLELGPAWYGEALTEMLRAGERYGAGDPRARERVQVEMVSANPTGPLTVGSARNGAYGDSVARLLELAGHEVEREYYFNDVGRQIELFRASVEAVRRGETPPEGGYVGDYVRELAAEDGDPVERTIEEIKAELQRFRVHFDSWVREEEVERQVPDALARLETYEAEGTLWARTSAHGDDKDRPLVRSADRSYLYFARDVAYLRNKLERGFDRAIYVLGADHHGYAARLRAAAAMLGYDPDAVEVLIYQLVHVTELGEAKRVSKRRGDVVFLRELLDKIGVDATRWYLVSRGHDQTIEIDVELARERTEKNPVYYVQYAHARIAGILRNAGDRRVGADPAPDVTREERELVKQLAEFPRVAAEAAERRAPHMIPVYAIRVADDFHRFYHHQRVLGSDAEAWRLGLCRATQLVIARSLDLIGVEAPERM
jgi:arginyl-tRNA synthetase